MKVGDLVCVETEDLSTIDESFQRISIVGIIVEFTSGFRDPYVRVYIIQTPTGRFVGGRYPFLKSEMRILNESRRLG